MNERPASQAVSMTSPRVQFKVNDQLVRQISVRYLVENLIAGDWLSWLSMKWFTHKPPSTPSPPTLSEYYRPLLYTRHTGRPTVESWCLIDIFDYLAWEPGIVALYWSLNAKYASVKWPFGECIWHKHCLAWKTHGRDKHRSRLSKSI